MKQYTILENVEGYDGLYVCYKMIYELTKFSNGPIEEMRLVNSLIIATSDNLETVRQYIPSNYIYFEGEKQFDQRLVEVWMIDPATYAKIKIQ